MESSLVKASLSSIASVCVTMSSLERDDSRRIQDGLLAKTRASHWASAHSKPDGPHLHLIRTDLQVSAASLLNESEHAARVCFNTCFCSSSSHVYKCVCQQHSELLYNDLMWKITSHLEQVSSELQVSAQTHLKSFFDDIHDKIWFWEFI